MSGPVSGSTSLRSPEPVPVSALPGNDPGYGIPMWAAGSLAAARFELKRMEALLGDEPFGAPKVSIYAADLYALIAAIEKMSATQSTGADQ